jgi:hypothetical protein
MTHTDAQAQALITTLIRSLGALPQVAAIALGGSRVTRFLDRLDALLVAQGFELPILAPGPVATEMVV